MQVDYVVHTYRMYSVQDVCLYIHVPMGCKVGNIGSYQSIVISSSKRELWTRKYKKNKNKNKEKRKKKVSKNQRLTVRLDFGPPFFFVLFSRYIHLHGRIDASFYSSAGRPLL